MNISKKSDHKDMKIIGFSELGNPLTVEFLGNKNSPLRIFILGGQHGDEKYGKLAINRLTKRLKNKEKINPLPFYAAFLTDSNPDGSLKKSRNNERKIDLNRDHQLLNAMETQNVHSFVRTWRPQLVIDVHNFPSRRKHLLDKNLIINYDVFVDIPNNPAIIPLFDNNKLNKFFTKIKSKLQTYGFTCERYTIEKSGRFRHSTDDIKDARNSLALRYGLFTILLEGKLPTKNEGEEGKKRTILSQYYSLRFIIDWAIKNQKHLIKFGKYIPKQNELVPIRSKYAKTNKNLEMIFKNSITLKSTKVKISNYYGEVEVTKFVNLPSNYVVSSNCQTIIDILEKHGFHHSNADLSIIRKISKKHKKHKLGKYVLFPTKQTGGRCLAVYLEPKSKYSLYRYPTLKTLLNDSLIPIARIEK